MTALLEEDCNVASASSRLEADILAQESERTHIDWRRQSQEEAGPGAVEPMPDEFEAIILNNSSVKRVGQGYQSNIGGPVESDHYAVTMKSRKSGLFNTARRRKSRALPEPDRRAASVDELGLVNPQSHESPGDERPNSLSFMRKAVNRVLGVTPVTVRSSRPS